MSTLDRLGLPQPIGIMLFTLGMVLALAPYFGGVDFGVLRVPNLSPEKTRVLKRFGWSLPFLGVLLFVPLWPEPSLVPAVTLPAAAQVEPDQSGTPRLVIRVRPVVPGDTANEAFQHFRGALGLKIAGLSGTIPFTDAFRYVEDLKVIDDTTKNASAGDMRAIWNRFHALQVLSLQFDRADPTRVTSLVHLGDLAPDGSSGALLLHMSAVPDSFARNQDSYELLTWYALARDAQNLNKETFVVAAYLAKAWGIAMQIDDPGGVLAPVRNDILKRLEELRGPGFDR